MSVVVRVDVRLHYYNTLLPSAYKERCLAFNAEKAVHDVTTKQKK